MKNLFVSSACKPQLRKLRAIFQKRVEKIILKTACLVRDSKGL